MTGEGVLFVFVFLLVFENSSSLALPSIPSNAHNSLKDIETCKLQKSDSDKGGF